MSWKNVIKIIILAASAGLRAFAGMADIAEGGSGVRNALNFVNFVRGCEPRDDANRDHLDEPLREEIARNTKYGFKNTILLQYDALLRDDLVALAKTAQQDRTEYGVWAEMCRQLVETCGIEWKGRNGWDWDWFVKPGFLMAYAPAERERICDELFRLFKLRFGAYPKTMGSWLLDAHSMDYVQRKYGVKAFLICREQDATDAYTLNGGYFNGAYYPSKNNALSAAVDMKNAIRAPVFRMLTPDPIYNYGTYANAGFNSFAAAGCPTMEPVGNPDVPWYFRLYGEPVAPLNLSYMQTGQENSFFWSRIHKSLDEQMAMAAKYAAEGKIAVETVSETAERFMRDHPANCPQTQIAIDDRTGADRQSVWYNSKHYRANLFLEDGKLRFRDIHVMDDADEEDWLRKACPDWRAEYHTPFVVDEKRLPTSGLVFEGSYTNLFCMGDGRTSLHVRAERADGTCATVAFGEGRLSVGGAGLVCRNARARELLKRFESEGGGYDFTRPRVRDQLSETGWVGDGEPDREEATFYDEDPAPEFKATFVLSNGVDKAKVTVACAGYYALALNGRPAGVSETSLMPLWSPFDRTVYADSLDVSTATGALLPYPATNVVTVTLGNGFYNLPPLRFWGSKCFRTALAHGRPCFKLTVDGVTEPLDWKWRKTNVIRNCVYLGAEIDATRTVGEVWKTASRVPGPCGAIVPRTAPPIAYTGAVAAQSVRQLANGAYIVDFGANLSGVPSFVFANEKRSNRIEIVYGELLNADGSVNVLTQTAGQIKRPGRGGKGAPGLACQRDAYICEGAASERFEPPFVWHICRYAEVRGAKSAPKATLRAVSSDLHPVAPGRGFASEEQKLQKLHEVCVRTFRDNLIGVQSDCPGRERLGYGGDIVASCEAMCLNFNMLEFYLKTLQDFADEAEGDGWLTETAPFVGIADADGLEAGGASRKGPISWALAVPVLMETLLRHYPDARERIFAYYPVCARYVRLMAASYPTGIVPKCIGDHEALERAPDEVAATAHYHEFVRLTARLATAAGRPEDAAEFAPLADGIRAAFLRAYVKDGIVANGTQSAQAIGLYLGLVDNVAAAEAELLKALEAKGFAPTTGIFSTRYMLMYLAEHGHNDIARKIVLHEGFPGWLHMLERGATTLWETWKESDDVYSNCHPMFGSVDEWILRYGGTR